MRLLGKCPNCGTEDSVVVERNKTDLKKLQEASCEQCGTVWESWYDLKPRLTPVSIGVNRRVAQLWFPSNDQIPAVRLIVSILNVALMCRFKLKPCFATEGGLEGRVEGEPIELLNIYETIGLYDGHVFEYNPVCERILVWYSELLRALFEEELMVGECSIGRGAILKLSHTDPLLENMVKGLLWTAIFKKTGSKGFANQVFEQANVELSNELKGSYITGLTDEQVAKIFVPPPL